MIAPLVAAAAVVFYAGGPVDEQRSIPVEVTGQVTVTAARPGGVRATIVTTPASGGTLEWHRTGRTVGGSFFPRGGDEEGQRRAVTERGTAPDLRRCVDAATAFDAIGVRGGRRLVLRVPAGGLGDRSALRTRCGGPLARDLGALPSTALGLRALRTGRRTLDLRTEHPFAAAGYAGTVRSTVRVRLGRVSRDRAQGRGATPDDDDSRIRFARYAITAVDGTLPLTLRGAGPSAVCGLLDSCGARGRLTLRPDGRRGGVRLGAVGRRRTTSREDLRAALAGAAPAGERITIGGVGVVFGRSTLTTRVARADGTACADEATAGPLVVELAVVGGRLRAALRALDGLASRCPGPLLATSALATGDVPVAALRRRTLRIPLDRGRTLRDDGWRAASRPALTLVLRRRG